MGAVWKSGGGGCRFGAEASLILTHASGIWNSTPLVGNLCPKTTHS
jgi:hypothetical protein